MPERQISPEQWLEMFDDPEVFPLYYPASAPFLDDGAGGGAPSGAAGAQATVNPTINNFPHTFYGVRVRNVYELPDPALADAFRAVKLVDQDQTIRIELAQENVTANATLQDHVVGGAQGSTGGIHWHPFPVPYLLAGGNEVNVVLRRLTSYPLLSVEPEIPVLPIAHVTLVTGVHRKDFRTVPPQRRDPR